MSASNRRLSDARTFNSRVIFVYKVALYQLDGKTRLADTTTADDHQLVLAEKLRRLANTLSSLDWLTLDAMFNGCVLGTRLRCSRRRASQL